MAATLSTRALNRATLARQLLLERSTTGVESAVEHLVGLQAQAPWPPYYGLWCRLDGFTGEQLGSLIVDRSVVRVVLMRGTVHLVTAADAHGLRPLLQPIMDRDLRTNTQHARHLEAVDVDAVAEAAAEVLAAEPQSAKALGARLAERWPGVQPAALAHAARGRLPLVQVPPRAVWGRSGPTVLTTLDAWVGPSREPGPTIDDLVVRYLRAFGPASVMDVQAWCGLTRLGEVADRLGDRLRRDRDEHGVELLDVPEAPRPDPVTPAPVRLLGDFDNVLLSYADRSRMMDEPTRRRLFRAPNGIIPGALLVDGFVAGTWSITRKRRAATVDVRPYAALSSDAVEGAVAEGDRLLALASPEADARETRVHAPDPG